MHVLVTCWHGAAAAEHVGWPGGGWRLPPPPPPPGFPAGAEPWAAVAAAPCRRWLSTHLDVGAPGEVNLFETTIRVLGGLLSAQALSAGSHPALARRLAEKAADLGARLMPAFNSPSGAPPPCAHNARLDAGSICACCRWSQLHVCGLCGAASLASPGAEERKRWPRLRSMLPGLLQAFSATLAAPRHTVSPTSAAPAALPAGRLQCRFTSEIFRAPPIQNLSCRPSCRGALL